MLIFNECVRADKGKGNEDSLWLWNLSSRRLQNFREHKPSILLQVGPFLLLALVWPWLRNNGHRFSLSGIFFPAFFSVFSSVFLKASYSKKAIWSCIYDKLGTQQNEKQNYLWIAIFVHVSQWKIYRFSKLYCIRGHDL